MSLLSNSKEELWVKYQKYRFSEVGDLQEILLPNDIFTRINALKVGRNHKALAFVVYAFSKFTKITNNPHPMLRIQELWGYSCKTRSLLSTVKKGGVLDKAGLTESTIQGLGSRERLFLNTEATKIEYKKPLYDVDTSKGKFFRVLVEPMLACMINAKELGVKGFYVYAFICLQAQYKAFGTNDLYRMTPIATKFISDGLGLSPTTVKNVLNQLDEFGLIRRIKTPITKIQGYTLEDANKILPLTVCPDCFPTIPEQATESITNSVPKPRHTKKSKQKEKQYVTNSHHPIVTSKEEEASMHVYMELQRLERRQELTVEALEKIITRSTGKVTPKMLEELNNRLEKLKLNEKG